MLFPKRIRIHVIAMAAVIIFMTMAKSVPAVDLIDLTSNNFVTWFETNDSGDRLAQAFATDGANNVIQSMALNLFSVDGNTKTFDLDIWSNSGSDTPAVPVANVVTGGSFASFSDQNFYQIGSLSIPLATSTTYWLVLTPAGAGQIRWGQTDNLTGGFTGFANAVRRSIDSGLNWPETTNLVQTRTRITAVPETSFMGLAGFIVLSAHAGSRYRRSKRLG